MSKKLLYLTIPIIILIIACLVALIFVTVPNSDGVYQQNISLAKKYAASNDYDKAVMYYKKAIDVDKTQESAYISLAELYYNHNNLDSAIAVLKSGVTNTNSKMVQYYLDKYIDSSGDMDGGEGLNIQFLDMFNSNTYSDYEKDFKVEKSGCVNGKYSVKYSGMDITFIYYDTVDTRVIRDYLPIGSAKPNEVDFSNVNDLFVGFGDTFTMLDIEDTLNVKVEKFFDNKLNKNIIKFKYHDCEIYVECDNSGKVTKDSKYIKVVPLNADNGVNVKVSGTVFNVTNKNPVEEFTMNFRQGESNEKGEVYNECSGRNGEYSVKLEAGTYTVEIIAEGYQSDFFPMYISSSESSLTKDFALSPTLGSGQIRIVLEWGAKPTDLDSHLDGKSSDSTNVSISFHNYKQKDKSGNDIASLDLDDTTSYGPETITLNDINGDYTYSVENYSGDGSLASSGATVKIYLPDNSRPQIIEVPSNVSGKIWEVFKIRNGQISDINGK